LRCGERAARGEGGAAQGEGGRCVGDVASAARGEGGARAAASAAGDARAFAGVRHEPDFEGSSVDLATVTIAVDRVDVGRRPGRRVQTRVISEFDAVDRLGDPSRIAALGRRRSGRCTFQRPEIRTELAAGRAGRERRSLGWRHASGS
jgi:hypothetical protein